MYVPGERNVLGAFGSAPVLCSPCCGSVLGAVGKEAGSGKVELIWEGGSRIGGGEMFWEEWKCSACCHRAFPSLQVQVHVIVPGFLQCP